MGCLCAVGICRKRRIRCLMVGLEDAGKTTILYNLKLGEFVTTIPTIGFNVETIPYRGALFEIWDVSGKDKARPMWQFYQQHRADVIVFVVDSADREEISEAREALRAVISQSDGSKALLVFCNKQDLPRAMKVDDIKDALNLDALSESWHVQACCAANGDGLYEGLNWIYWKLR